MVTCLMNIIIVGVQKKIGYRKNWSVWTNCTFVFYTNIWGKANTCKSYKNKNRHRKNV